MRLKPKIYNEIDFDSIEAGERARYVLRNKKCLREIYVELYVSMMEIRDKLLVKGGKVLEIGSGGGFIKDLFPEVITSDVKQISGVDRVFSAVKLPFEDNSLDAILAIHVLHHIPDVEAFLNEAKRVLKQGGGIVCVEPYWGPLAQFVFTYIHPEPFDKNAQQWQLAGDSPMTSSNQAMSYLLLKRDKDKFAKLFPDLRLVFRKKYGFVRYFMTGGIWLDQKLPDFVFPILKIIDLLLTPLFSFVGLHQMFVWKKIK